ncbi:MAG: ParB/RepB/Spo0J family partition protein [bacterium]
MHKALGRGLEALIPTARASRHDRPIDEKAYRDQVLQIKIERIKTSKYQPRQKFDQKKIDELSDSIREKGVIQPILVRTCGNQYELIAGERRWRAVKQLGLPEIPAIVKDVSDRDMFEISLIENIQREELNALEEAEAYRQLIEDFGLTQEELSGRIGKDRSSIANILRLLKLPDGIKHLMVDGLISAGHARTILSLETLKKQEYLVKRIVKHHLTVRQAEDIVKKVKGKGLKERKEKGKDIELLQIEQDLQRFLGTQVKITHRGHKGKIEITYFSEKDFDRIVGLINKK